MYVCGCFCVMGMTIHEAPYLQIKLFELFTKLQIHISTLEGYQCTMHEVTGITELLCLCYPGCTYTSAHCL